jgi:hypothetical protein
LTRSSTRWRSKRRTSRSKGFVASEAFTTLAPDSPGNAVQTTSSRPDKRRE